MSYFTPPTTKVEEVHKAYFAYPIGSLLCQGALKDMANAQIESLPHPVVFIGNFSDDGIDVHATMAGNTTDPRSYFRRYNELTLHNHHRPLVYFLALFALIFITTVILIDKALKQRLFGDWKVLISSTFKSKPKTDQQSVKPTGEEEDPLQ